MSIMKLAAYAFLALLLVSAANCRVEELSDASLDSAKRGTTLVLFYVPWGADNKLALAEIDQFSGVWKGRIAKLDLSMYPRVGTQESVYEYPTLRVYRDGAESTYSGQWESLAIRNWVQTQQTGGSYSSGSQYHSYSREDYSSNRDSSQPSDAGYKYSSADHTYNSGDYDKTARSSGAASSGSYSSQYNTYSTDRTSGHGSSDQYRYDRAESGSPSDYKYEYRYTETSSPSGSSSQGSGSYGQKDYSNTYGSKDYKSEDSSGSTGYTPGSDNYYTSSEKYQGSSSGTKDDPSDRTQERREYTRESYEYTATDTGSKKATYEYSSHQSSYQDASSGDSGIISFEGDDAIQEVLGKEQPALILFSDDTRSSQYREFESAARANKGKIIFSHATVTTGLGKRLAEHLGVRASQTPAVFIVVAKDEDVRKYRMDGSITRDNIQSFIAGYNRGALKKYYKSQDAPSRNDGVVKVVVGDNFREIVINSPQHVMVMFYAPWCSHCKSMAPEYESAAQALSSNRKYLIVKVDATENDIEDYEIKSFPTVLFFAAGKKDAPLHYDGERTKDGIIEFFKENGAEDWRDL
jgi:protein disulfide-isomerase-like protein